MAVVYVREIYRGVGLKVQGAGRAYEGSVTRKFLVRVDSFSTSGGAICAAPGVSIGDRHPAFQEPWTASDFSVDCEDGSGLMWGVTVTYKAAAKELTDAGLPKDEWSLSSGTALVPCLTYFSNPSNPTERKPLVNSTNTPIEGLKKEQVEFSWKLVRSFETATAMMTQVYAYTNTVNNAQWSFGGAGMWKCDFKGGSPKKLASPLQTNAGDPANENQGADGEVTSKTFWEAVFEFRCNADTWNLRPWDQGYMKLSTTPGSTGQKVAILDANNKPLREPTFLDGHGQPLAQGSPPYRFDAPIYPRTDFSQAFTPPA